MAGKKNKSAFNADRARYIHISKPIMEVPDEFRRIALAKGQMLASRVVSFEKGITYILREGM